MVSVIIPTYNREKLIIRSINSVLNQTYSDLEVLVIDDCSTDNTQQVIKTIVDSRLRYIRLSENKGACAARNIGISLAKGDVVAFQDSDDEWDDNKLKEQIDVLLRNDADMCICKMQTLNANGDFIKETPDIPLEEMTFERLLYGNFISTQMLVVKKCCLNDNKFDESFPRLQDWDLALRLKKKYKMAYVDKVLVTQYIQNDSITSSNLKYVLSLKKIYEKYKKDFDVHKKAKINVLEAIIKYSALMRLNSRKYCFDLLKIQFSRKNMAKFVLSSVGLLPYMYQENSKRL